MHKDGKWARQILALQKPDGSWGFFHSLSEPNRFPMTTEQALRRLKRLGYGMEDECIQRAASYMTRCLTGQDAIPDRREKVHDWGVFTALMLAAQIRVFTKDAEPANRIAIQWAEIITKAFPSGTYDHEQYVSAYRSVFGLHPSGGRLIDFVNFYPIALLPGCLDERTERAFIDHVLRHESGMYYICESRLDRPPEIFESRKASRYLAAIELLAEYPSAKEQLQFVVRWLEAYRNESGRWDMSKDVNDKIYFPLSDSWRKAETREADCTERISALLEQLI